MGKFLVSHERRSRVALSGCTSFKKKQQKKSGGLSGDFIIPHSSHRLKLMFDNSVPAFNSFVSSEPSKWGSRPLNRMDFTPWLPFIDRSASKFSVSVCLLFNLPEISL